MTRFRPTVAEVDLDAVRHNVRTLKPPDAELMAVVKGDGYGHGDVPIARAALDAGASRLGVALVEEGVRLRDHGISASIHVLSEFPPGSEKEALSAGLIPTLYTTEGLAGLVEAAEALNRRVGVHLKLDTGMHRVGLWPPTEAVAFARKMVEAGLVVDGLWTHFALAEDDPEATRAQLRLLIDARDALEREGIRPTFMHSANSAATIGLPETHLDLVRPGVALYGLDPGNGLGPGAGLRPALTWRSSVSMVKRLPAGEGLSYGWRYRLDRDANVATVPVGYDDGYRRELGGRADVLIGGRRRRVAGVVTMDQLIVDCGDAEVVPGDEVILIGSQGDERITAEELAGHQRTIGYEVVTSIGARVPRDHLH